MEFEEHPISDADEETLIRGINSITIEEADVFTRILTENGISQSDDEDLGLMVLALRKDEEMHGQLLGQVGKRIREHIERAVSSGDISLELLEVFSSTADAVIEKGEIGEEVQGQKQIQMDRFEDVEDDEGNWLEQEQQHEEHDEMIQQFKSYFDSSDLILTRELNKQRQAEQHQAKKYLQSLIIMHVSSDNPPNYFVLKYVSHPNRSWCLRKFSIFLGHLMMRVKDIPSMLDAFHSMLLRIPELKEQSQELLKEIGELARHKIYFEELRTRVAEIIVRYSFS